MKLRIIGYNSWRIIGIKIVKSNWKRIGRTAFVFIKNQFKFLNQFHIILLVLNSKNAYWFARNSVRCLLLFASGDPGSEICYNDHCHGAITPCLDSRNDKKVFKQVCVAGERYVRVQADLCRHIQTGSSDTGFFEVAQPSVCPTESKNAGGFITAGGNLIQIGSVRVANDLYPFSIHQIRCHSAVTPTCFLIRQGGQVSKVAVCGRCDKAGDVINATVTHEQLRGGTHFHRKVDPKCRQGKLVCGDGRNYRMFIYLVLSGLFWIFNQFGS